MDEAELIDRGLRFARVWTANGTDPMREHTYTDVLLEFLDEAHADGFPFE